jgi:enamine deaminase RidA (YjgF/YER057c/UK114 family)
MTWHSVHRLRGVAAIRGALTLVALAVVVPSAAQDVRLRAIAPDTARGTAAAVVVETGALVHTALLFPEDGDGRLQHDGNAHAQGAYVLDTLHTALAAAGSGLRHLVRLHVYLTDAASMPAVERLLAERFRGVATPAVTFVETAPIRAGALVAMDAIAAAPPAASRDRPSRLVVRGLPPQPLAAAHVARQPDGPFVIVSGRAAQGDLDTAIAGTLDQLRADLKGVGLGFEHVVQIKSFVRDVQQAADVRTIVAKAFAAPAPPQVATEWLRGSAPAEIELVAAGAGVRSPAPAAEDGITHIEPISSRYSRVAVVHRGRPVFISGLYGASADPAAQVTEMFDELGRLLAQAGSDPRHLVKATYYVSDTAADRAINDIRPKVFDPERPPAASKISVRGTARPGRGSTFDMIAVTTGP